MSDFAKKLLPMVKKTLRQADDEFDDEIGSYIDTVATDLQDAGILYTFFASTKPEWVLDGQILQACRWYALSVFGLYNQDMEKYAKAYASLKSTLATQKRYTTEGKFASGYEDGYHTGYTEGYSSGEQSTLARLTDLTVTSDGVYLPGGSDVGFKSVSVDVPSKIPSVVGGTITELTEKDLEGVSVIKKYAFADCENLKKVALPATIREIQSSAFSACNSLTGVYVKDIAAFCTIEYANNTAIPLYYAKNLYLDGNPVVDLTIPSTVFDISKNAFRRCSTLVNLTIGSNVKTIGSTAFGECENLKTVNFERNSVFSKIESSVFSDCSSLEVLDFSMYAGMTVPTLASVSAFKGVSSSFRIIVPFHLYDVWCSATNWISFKDYIISAPDTAKEGYLSFDDNYSNIIGNVQKVIIDGKELGRITEIDKTKTYIGKYVTVSVGTMKGIYVDEYGKFVDYVVIKAGYNVPLRGVLNDCSGIQAYESSIPI